MQVQRQDLGTPGSGDVDDWDDKAALMAKQVPFIVGKIKHLNLSFSPGPGSRTSCLSSQYERRSERLGLGQHPRDWRWDTCLSRATLCSSFGGQFTLITDFGPQAGRSTNKSQADGLHVRQNKFCTFSIINGRSKKSYLDILCITIHLPLDKLVLLLKLVGVSTQKPQIVSSLGFCNVSPDCTTLTQPANHLDNSIRLFSQGGIQW